MKTPAPPAADGAAHWPLRGFYFAYFAYIGIFSPYFALYLADRGLSTAAIGLVMAAPQATRVVATHLWGWLADRRGGGLAVARMAGLAGTLAFLPLLGGGDFGVMFCAVAVMSFFWSAALPIAEVTTLGHLKAQIGRYGRIRAWGSVGFIAAVLGTGTALDHVPTSVIPLLITGALAAILCVLWWMADAPASGVADASDDGSSLWRRFRDPSLIALFVACALMAAAHGPYYTFFSLYLVGIGYSKTAVGALWALGVVCEIVVFLAMPQLTRALSLRTILIGSFVLAALRFLLIAWGAQHLALLLVAQLLHAATFGSFHAAALGLVQRSFPERQKVRGQAAYTSLTAGVGGTLGTLASGVLWQKAGAAVTFSVAAGCAAVGAVLLARTLRVRSGA